MDLRGVSYHILLCDTLLHVTLSYAYFELVLALIPFVTSQVYIS